MFSYEVITPALPPVSATDLRAWLRTSDTTEDSLLSSLLAAAADKFRVDSGGCVLGSTTLRLNLECMPGGWNGPLPLPAPVPARVVWLCRKPVTAVSLVEYRDGGGTWQTLSGWTAALTGFPAQVFLPPVPSLWASGGPVLRVTFTAGYSTVPDLAALGVKLLAAHWYTNREAFGSGMGELAGGWLSICRRFSTGASTDWNLNGGVYGGR